MVVLPLAFPTLAQVVAEGTIRRAVLDHIKAKHVTTWSRAFMVGLNNDMAAAVEWFAGEFLGVVERVDVALFEPPWTTALDLDYLQKLERLRTACERARSKGGVSDPVHEALAALEGART